MKWKAYNTSPTDTDSYQMLDNTGGQLNALQLSYSSFSP